MTDGTHHREALIETAQLELDRAHDAAKSMSAGDIRRGLDIAVISLREAQSNGDLQPYIDRLEQALVALDAGKLSAVGALIEQLRKELETLSGPN